MSHAYSRPRDVEVPLVDVTEAVPVTVAEHCLTEQRQQTQYIGQGASLATYYFETDFNWTEHAAAVRHVVQQQAEEGARYREAQRTRDVDANKDLNNWESFYQAHPSAKFFKERRYILLEFPVLRTCQHVVELGAGCGSSILPVLKANPAARATLTDVSSTCLDQLRWAAQREGITHERVTTFVADSASPAAAHHFHGVGADCALIMFTLSAVAPDEQRVMLSHAFAALQPGGKLLVRDHGLYDMVQLRIPASQWLSDNFYQRGDGTHAYFFSPEDLQGKALAAGFDVAECRYVCVTNTNRKTGLELRRVFVHGVFTRPLAP